MFAKIERRDAAGMFDETDDRKSGVLNALDLDPLFAAP
jgi:hypothetical protein